MAFDAFDGFPNLVTLFFDRAAEKGDKPFLWRKDKQGWQSIGWRDAARQVAGFAESLRQLGFEPGDRIMLVSENRPEWCIADLGIMAAGCITVPTYTSNSERDHQHILDDSGARGVIVSTARLAQTLLPAVIRSSAAEHVIGMEELSSRQAGQLSICKFSDLALGSDEDVVAARQRASHVERADLACIIYTSGTGGAPRGVRQHHGAILHNVAGASEVIANDFGWDNEVFLSFLPLSHAYEHSGGQFFPIGLGAQIYYAEGLEKLASNIHEVRPTIMVVVPRLFEVLRARIIKGIEKQGKLPRFFLARAQEIGARRYDGHGRLLDRPMDLILERMFRPKIRAKFGGRLKAMVSGGAPLNPDIGLFFESLGLCLLQGYGQTEAAPIISCNRPRAGIKMDTVGPPLMNTEVRIAEDGELLVRGELVMHGYWHNDSETRRVLRDGWLHTGDIGHLDEAGRIVITDRKKDLIVNDKGDNVAPQKVEGMLTLQPEISQAMIYGDRRPYMVGLIVPDAEWAVEFCKAHGCGFDFSRIQDRPEFRKAVGEAVDRVNSDLSQVERVRRFIFAEEPFTIENGEMTPSMKIRRHIIRERYGARLDGMYRG
ncbi:AMP-dependent synthetase/ligase [Novosphingopyxis sp.]|uniref:AMP-dependent synthetase/ligase n=1 Tax=Novosphingopyxis sp. TaxID=2709690 RepID=UPI003B5A1867